MQLLHPNTRSCCPMAGMIDPEGLLRMKKEHPGAAVVTYVNTYADVKAETDYCCTSGNAVRVAEAIDSDRIIFLPDEFLAKNVALETGKKMWNSKGVGKGSLCYADDMLYLFSENKGKAGLATCSPEGMDMRGTFQVEGTDKSWAYPVVTGGRLYLRYADNLYCYNVSGN